MRVDHGHLLVRAKKGETRGFSVKVASVKTTRPASVSFAYYLSLVATLLGVAGGFIMLRSISRYAESDFQVTEARTAAIICIVTGLAVGALASATHQKSTLGWKIQVGVTAVSVIALAIVAIVGRGGMPLLHLFVVLAVLVLLVWPTTVRWFYLDVTFLTPGRRPKPE